MTFATGLANRFGNAIIAEWDEPWTATVAPFSGCEMGCSAKRKDGDAFK
jgi:hypothetical protein